MRKIISLFLLQFTWLVAPAQERQWFSETDIAGLDFPGGARNNAVSFVIGDTAYVGTGDTGSTTTDFWKFVPSTNTWTQIADFPGSRRSGAVAFALGNQGYVGTGKGAGEYYKDFWKYDPIDNTWTQIADFPGDGRSAAVAFTVNGMAYVGAGAISSSSYKKDFWKYDPNTNAWTAIADLPGNARTGPFAFAADGFGYVGGGYRSGPNTVIDLYSYDPNLGVWEEKGTGYEDFRREDGVAFVLDSKAYIGLGLFKKDFLVYDLATGVTSNATGPEDHFGRADETSRWGAVSFVVRGKAFVGLGGANGGATTNHDIWSFQYPIPNAPEALTVSAVTLTEATLEWDDRSNNEQGFSVERSVSDSTSFSPLASLSTDVTTYQDNTIANNHIYYYRVQAVGQSDNSSYTKLVSVNTYRAPDQLTASMQIDTTVTLSWQDNSTIETGFVVERSVNAATYISLDTLEANRIAYTDTLITTGIDYRYRVYALVNDVATDATNTATVGILTSPTSLRAEAPNSTTVQLTWNYRGSNAANYVIERKTEEDDFVELVSMATEDGELYSDTGAEEGRSYTYRIKTIDATRVSGYSVSVRVTTALHAPRTVTAVADSTGVTVRWRDVSERETNYLVRRSFADGSEETIIATLAANTIVFYDTTLLDSGDYRYIIQASGNDALSGGVGSNPVTFVRKKEVAEEAPKEEIVTGIDDETMAEIVKAYPNPSNGVVSVYVGSERFAYVAVFNNQGRLVSEVQQAEQGSNSVVNVNLQHYPVGMYTLRVYTARGVVVKKIAKQ